MQVSMRQKILGIGVLLAGCLGSGGSMGAILGVTGDIDALATAPPSVKLGHLTSNTDIFAFTEHTGLTLPSDVAVNITAPGTYDSTASLTPGTVAAGTVVDSYLLHADTASGSHMFDGTVTFSAPILGVLVLSHALNVSDPILGAPGTAYPTGDSERGLELKPDQDFVSLSSDMRTLTVHYFTHGNIDELRVLTAVTPEPSSLVIAGGGMLFLTAALRLKKRRSA